MAAGRRIPARIDLKLGQLAFADANKAQPVDLEITATYSPDNIFVTRGRLGAGDLSLTSQINATPQRTEFRQFELKKGSRVRAAGSLSVPLGFARLRPGQRGGYPTGEVQAEVKLNGLRLADGFRLLGRDSPWRGELSGNLTAHGPLNDFSAEGKLALTNGTFPASWLGLALEDVSAEAEFSGTRARLSELRGHARGGIFSGAGELNIRHLLDPNLRVGLRGQSVEVATGALAATGDFEVTLSGLASQAYLEGNVQLTRAKFFRPDHRPAIFHGHE